jgi:hypothetical protein
MHMQSCKCDVRLLSFSFFYSSKFYSFQRHEKTFSFREGNKYKNTTLDGGVILLFFLVFFDW